MCASALPDSRRVERGTGFHPQPERCRVLFVIGKILFPALLLVLIFQTLLGEKFSTVFGAVLERFVYRYEGNLNGIENAVVLLSYPEKAFGNPKALRAFISTNVALSTQEILSWYVCRWPIEVFFRQCKEKLALDGYQIRSAQGIKRYWLLMSLAHFMCAVGTGRFCSFETGYHEICDTIQLEKYRYLFQCAKESNDFDSFMKFAV